MKLFGKAQKAPAPKDALQKLNETLATLQKRQEFLQSKIDKETTAAKQYAVKNKKMALACLKRKQLYVNQLATIEAMRTTIEQQVMQLENVSMAAETLAAMKTGSSVMKQARSQMQPDEVAALMDDITEQAQDADEMQRALSQPVGETFDDDELEQELAALELEDQALKDTAPPSYAAVFTMPSVPATELLRPPATVAAPPPPRVSTAPSKENNDDDFSKLSASMN